MKDAIIAIDQGTTSTRAVLFDSKGKAMHMEQEEIISTFPFNGWVEQNPIEIWDKTKKVLSQVLSKSDLLKCKIHAIGITNQRETIVAWDKVSGEVIYNAIIWQDRRTSKHCEKLIANGLSETISKKTGLIIDPYFSATKISWILDNIEEANSLALRGKLAVGTIDTFLLYRLTKGKSFYTDITNASRTSLYNIHKLTWDNSLLEIFDIPIEILPIVKNNIYEFGFLDSSIFGKSIPILSMAGDQQSSSIGQFCINAGDVKATFGTGCFILMNSGTKILKSQNKLLSTIAFKIDNDIKYALEGSIFISGAAVQWLRDNLKIIKNAEETQELASSLKDNNGVYFVPAFTGLGAPHWNPNSKGLIYGLSRSSGIAEITRAVLESVAYQCTDLLDAMRSDGQTPKVIRVDGGMSTNDWLMQFLSNISETQIEKTVNRESTSYGVAILAAIGSGLLKSIEESSINWSVNKFYKPEMNKNEINKYRNGWQQAIKKTIL